MLPSNRFPCFPVRGSPGIQACLQPAIPPNMVGTSVASFARSNPTCHLVPPFTCSHVPLCTKAYPRARNTRSFHLCPRSPACLSTCYPMAGIALVPIFWPSVGPFRLLRSMWHRLAWWTFPHVPGLPGIPGPRSQQRQWLPKCTLRVCHRDRPTWLPGDPVPCSPGYMSPGSHVLAAHCKPPCCRCYWSFRDLSPCPPGYLSTSLRVYRAGPPLLANDSPTHRGSGIRASRFTGLHGLPRHALANAKPRDKSPRLPVPMYASETPNGA